MDVCWKYRTLLFIQIQRGYKSFTHSLSLSRSFHQSLERTAQLVLLPTTRNSGLLSLSHTLRKIHLLRLDSQKCVANTVRTILSLQVSLSSPDKIKPYSPSHDQHFASVKRKTEKIVTKVEICIQK